MCYGGGGHKGQKELKKRINEYHQITNRQGWQIHPRFIGPYEKQQNFKIANKHYLNSFYAL